MKAICVYCGSSSDIGVVYKEAAKELGQCLIKRNCELIYGGSNLGLMGIVANTVLSGGGQVTAVMPKDLEKRAGHGNSAKLIVVDDMHQRKQKMFELADGFIALPGGFGTLDEIFEMLTWRCLGYHEKPCGFLNVDGYFDHLLNFLDHSSAQGFIKPEHRELAFSRVNIPDLMECFQELQIRNADKF